MATLSPSLFKSFRAATVPMYNLRTHAHVHKEELLERGRERAREHSYYPW